ncbi:LysE/ArgO family amino acid transporter [Pendulispora albinea]|uniref:LysE family transporter n=1 Tax=Pendulispora albinea TaxID=2741071 RepID=A0ABZ2M1Q6_9BACT
MSAILEGFALGLAYAAPIGAQNVYVIQSAAGAPLRLSLRTALVVTVMDISLALACLYGVGAVLGLLPWLRVAMTIVGALFLLVTGINLARRRGESVDVEGAMGSYAWSRIVVTAFVLTWLNPQALLDGTLLLGGFRAQLGDADVPFFVLGMASASTVWFHTVTLLVGTFRARFSVRIMTWINRCCGVALCALGISLARSVVRGW